MNISDITEHREPVTIRVDFTRGEYRELAAIAADCGETPEELVKAAARDLLEKPVRLNVGGGVS